MNSGVEVLKFFFWIGYSNPVALLGWDIVYAVSLIYLLRRWHGLNLQADINVLSRKCSSASDVEFAAAHLDDQIKNTIFILAMVSFLYIVLKVMQFLYFDSFSALIEHYKLLFT